MSKLIISVERELRSKSARIIWALISTPEGLSKWIADEVEANGEQLTFVWGNRWQAHEIKHARILEQVAQSYSRYIWEEDEESGNYWELRMDRNELTGDYMLSVTDVAHDGDTETVVEIWEDNMERLHRNTGL